MQACKTKQVVCLQQIRSATGTHMRIQKMHGTAKNVFQLSDHLKKLQQQVKTNIDTVLQPYPTGLLQY